MAHRRRLPRPLALAAGTVVGVFVVLFGGMFAVGAWFLDPAGTPVRFDFLAFWTAARLAMSGGAAAAYDPTSFAAAQAAVGVTGLGLPLYWLNPPSFLLILAPFGLPPYPAAFIAWVATGAAAYALAMRAALPEIERAWLPALALPAVFVCAWHGQNGLLLAALLAGCFALLPVRPILAGICLGLVSIKPQFGVLMPLLLAVGGQWRCFGAAAATVLALGLGSAAAFGVAAWLAFLDAPGRVVGSYLSGGVLDNLQSVYGMVAVGHGPGWLAWAVHGTVAAAAILACVRIWHRGASLEVRAASAIAGGFLLPPYMLPYDLVAVGVSAAFLLRAGLRRGFLAGEVALLAFVAVLPGAGLLVRTTLIGPLAFGLLLLLAVRRFAVEGGTVTAGGSAPGSGRPSGTSSSPAPAPPG